MVNMHVAYMYVMQSAKISTENMFRLMCISITYLTYMHLDILFSDKDWWNLKIICVIYIVNNKFMGLHVYEHSISVCLI